MCRGQVCWISLTAGLLRSGGREYDLGFLAVVVRWA